MSMCPACCRRLRLPSILPEGVFALKPLLNNVHMEQAQKADAKAEVERLRRFRLVHQRGDLTRARELVVDGLKELPGHVELLEFAEEIGAQLPPRAAQIVAERARVTELIQGVGVDG